MKAHSFLSAPTAGLALCSALLTGCGEASKPTAPVPVAGQKPAAQKTTAQTVIEGVTGKTAVDQGMAAREKLRAIDAQRRKDMESLTP